MNDTAHLLPELDQRVKKLMARLIANLAIDNETGCYVWTGQKSVYGYGRMSLTRENTKRSVAVHRVAAALFLDVPLNDPRLVLHSCDNPACWNPQHLRPGTAADNAQDRAKRNRAAIGSRSGKAKLDEATVREIRIRARAGAVKLRLAREYGISNSQIYTICSGKQWKHVVI